MGKDLIGCGLIMMEVISLCLPDVLRTSREALISISEFRLKPDNNEGHFTLAEEDQSVLRSNVASKMVELPLKSHQFV
jgi:hypothetical protein